MVSKLQENNGIYYCSNCRMRQYELKPNCVFCGDWFSNYESIIINKYDEAEKNKGEYKNESNSH